MSMMGEIVCVFGEGEMGLGDDERRRPRKDGRGSTLITLPTYQEAGPQATGGRLRTEERERERESGNTRSTPHWDFGHSVLSAPWSQFAGGGT